MALFKKRPNTPGAMEEQTLISHLIELRNRVLRAIMSIFIVFIGLSFFAGEIYHLLATPLLERLPEDSAMIATEVASPFLTPFKLSAFVALMICMPYILYQAWAFIAPGLYENEQRFALPLLISSIILFYLGMCFAFFVVFPLVFGFFTRVAPEGVTIMTDINQYLNFVLMLFFAFGLAFEVPIATLLLVKTGITTAKELAAKRPYIIVGAFVVGMLLTPPDVISQTLLAVPMWCLFELGLIMCKHMIPAEPEQTEAGINESKQ
jgi:sec-independent protein translocase protein TatC